MNNISPVSQQTDVYFTNTRKIVEKFGESHVTYAVFMRRRVMAALQPAIDFIEQEYNDTDLDITRNYEEGDLVPAEKSLLYITGSFSKLAELETLYLQKIGLPCVSAYNAYHMTLALPKAKFMDMHARHGFSEDMCFLASYGATVGSKSAQKMNSAVQGFVGTSQQTNAHLFPNKKAMGTTPHALIGYAKGDIVKAMDMYSEACPNSNAMIALVDYNGQEITDSIRAAQWFENKRIEQNWADKFFGVRLDTHGGRFSEGLDYESSVKILEDWTGVQGEYNIVESVLGERAFNMDTENKLVDKTRKMLFAKGVSAANIINTRNKLDEAGYRNAVIVASSGFDTFKCEVMSAVNAPIDMVGTGSYLPETMKETHVTSDIINYDGTDRVKVGRENLLK